MSKILSGTEARQPRIDGLRQKIKGFSPARSLAIIQVGEREDSSAYIRAKIAFGRTVGADVRHLHLRGAHSTDEIVSLVHELNQDSSIGGIIVQLPLPQGFDTDKVIASIDPRKDVDGLTETNQSLLEKGDPRATVPATARGVFELLDFYGISVEGKKMTVIGRSALVGKPIAIIASRRGAIVTVAHSKTLDLASETKGADIIIVAVGKAGLLAGHHVSPGQTIVDVGINDASDYGNPILSDRQRRIVGDVSFAEASRAIGPDGAISPVPGGVGPMTVLALFENFADACDKIKQ